jgi:hypothetical protein
MKMCLFLGEEKRKTRIKASSIELAIIEAAGSAPVRVHGTTDRYELIIIN